MKQHITMKALITGITGQDGGYLAELLLSKGYEVVGVVRKNSKTNRAMLPIKARLVTCDITNSSEVEKLIITEQPDEIYSLAAVSDYALYSADPLGSHLVNGVAPVLLMEAMRKHCPTARMFQAGTCQAYGKPAFVPQDENTPFDPPNPYSVSKVYAQYMARYYRREFGLFIVNGVLFSHESVRRVEGFVTRKITKGVAAIKKGKADSITLGNLEAKRDWGFASDFVLAFWLALQQKKPDDYVIGTGESHTVREFLSEAFLCAGIKDWQKYVKQDERFMRGTDADLLRANPAKIKAIGWKPTMGFKEIVKMMVENDLKN